MFLLGFVNSTFEARRPAGHLELVHLSLETAHRERVVLEKEEKQVEHHDATIVSSAPKKKVVVVVEKKKKKKGNGVVRQRWPSVEDLTPDLYMEPLLCPLVLKSPKEVREQDDVDQEWSFWNLDCQDVSRRTAIADIRLASAFAESGISTGVQHHPLEVTEERDTGASERDTKACERETTACESSGHGDEGFERILQHLQRIEGSVKELKARVDDAKLRIEQSEHEWGQDCDQAAAAAAAVVVALPLVSSPSLSSPVMEKMGGSVASSELPYSWNKKMNPSMSKSESCDGGARGPNDEILQEERELRYSPPLADSDVQDVLSFRLWEQEVSPAPKPKRRSSRKKQEIDLETALDLVADEYAMSKDLKLPLPHPGLRRYRGRNLYDDAATKTSTSEKTKSAADQKASTAYQKASTAYQKASTAYQKASTAYQKASTADQKTSAADQKTSTADQKTSTADQKTSTADQKTSTGLFDLRSRRAQPKVKVGVEEEFNNPSPCSFTCGLSPTSLFSDDQEPFQMSVSIDESMYFKMFSSGKASPRSVLSPKDDEVSRSDNSCAYLYDGESSDLESPTKVPTSAAPPPPFPTFTYNLGRDEMGETSSSDESESSLEFFHEAADSSPWLGRDGGLDASDLEFLLSPDMKTSIIAFENKKPSPKPKKSSPKLKSWVPYVKGEVHAPPARGGMRHEGDVFVASLPREKTKRSVNFAADLVKEIPHSPEPTFDKKPAPTSMNIPRKKMEAPPLVTSRRRSGRDTAASPGVSRSGSRRQKVVEAVACSGKLFSWPQKLSFKVNKGKVGSEEDVASFGTSARRDAEQVRRILKGSQKRYSNLTVDEIMKEDFSKR